MKFYFTIILFFLIILVITNALSASEAEVLKDIFRIEKENLGTLFADSFLDQVSLNQIEAIVNQYGNVLGVLQSAEKTESGYSLHFEKGTAPAQISLNKEGKIIGLWFGNYSLSEDNLDTVLAELKKLPGELSVSVIKNYQEKVLSYNEQKPMAVGSTFKLHVLKKLYDEIEESDKSWSDVVGLEAASKSMPTGILQDWPAGTPLTLRTLSNLMISQSDNTATDHLIDFIGREEIEEGLREENIPFLTTREFFILKFSNDVQMRENYLNSDLKEKRDILAEISEREFNNIEVGSKPILIDRLEWYFSTEELAELIYQLRDAPEIKINPGLVNKDDYYLAGFKGGSEPGVLQFTQLLQKTKGSDIYAVSVTFNNPEQALDQQKLSQLTSRLIAAVLGK